MKDVKRAVLSNANEISISDEKFVKTIANLLPGKDKGNLSIAEKVIKGGLRGMGKRSLTKRQFLIAIRRAAKKGESFGIRDVVSELRAIYFKTDGASMIVISTPMGEN